VAALCIVQAAAVWLATRTTIRPWRSTFVPLRLRNDLTANNFHLVGRLGTVVALERLVNWL